METLYCKTTHHLLGHILSLRPNADDLKTLFQSNQINWDQFVTVASGELMLPASYLLLKKKRLLSEIPSELCSYLESITSINRNRNTTLLSEAHEVTQLLTKNKIEHVFIKGIAMIASNPINDIGFRMIGDIDILVKREQIEKAHKLLITNGYNNLKPFNYEVKGFRHYPRQISANKYGAIELHENLLNSKTNHLLNPSTILKNKIILSGLPIPAIEDSIYIAVYTTQINDKLQKIPNVKFKSTFDVLVLGMDIKSNHYKNLKTDKYGRLFLNLSSVYFFELKSEDKKKFISYKFSIFKLLSKTNQLKRIFIKTLTIFLSVNERLQLFLLNKSYRKHIIFNKMLKNKE